MTGEDMQAAADDLSDYPDWQRESILKAREVLREAEQFIELPGQFDVHEYKIMENFCHDPENRGVGPDLLRLIKGSGAFRR